MLEGSLNPKEYAAQIGIVKGGAGKRNDAAKEVTHHVGSRILALRHLRGNTQSNLAKRIGISFQQLQKYETGFNRVSASTLFTIAGELKVHPGYFFEGLPGLDSDPQPKLDLEAMKLASAIIKLPNQGCRKAVETLVNSLSNEGRK